MADKSPRNTYIFLIFWFSDLIPVTSFASGISEEIYES
jgi:hypothetical protein